MRRSSSYGTADVQELDDLGNITAVLGGRRCAPNQLKCDEHTNQSYDQVFTGRFFPIKPIYKPEYWEKVQCLDENTNTEDPIFECVPAGITRMGPPRKIVQTADEVILFYAQNDQPFRIIPTDGRKHTEEQILDTTFYGHPVGRWEGDTLVVESVGFNDITWFFRGGYFHSDEMRLTERFRREGDTLRYEVTVHDPNVLLEPWVIEPWQLILNRNVRGILEGFPCRAADKGNMTLKFRH